MNYTATGILRYSPKLLGASSSKWWFVLDCNEQLGRYYRALFFFACYKTHKLLRPSWKEHVSIVRDEEPPDEKKHLWEKYAGCTIEFEYTPFVETDGVYFWLPVVCEKVLDIREELGLPRYPRYSLHLTIGNDYPEG